jgi:hypothetical protein
MAIQPVAANATFIFSPHYAAQKKFCFPKHRLPGVGEAESQKEIKKCAFYTDLNRKPTV